MGVFICWTQKKISQLQYPHQNTKPESNSLITKLTLLHDYQDNLNLMLTLSLCCQILMTVRAITALPTQLVWTSSMDMTASVLQDWKEYTVSQVSNEWKNFIFVFHYQSKTKNICLHYSSPLLECAIKPPAGIYL